MGVITGLLDRVFRLSDFDFHETNKNKVVELLLANNYPRRLIDRCLSSYSFIEGKKDQRLLTNFFRFPYIGGLSPKIDRLIRPRGGKLAFYNLKTVNSVYSRLKDPIPLLQQSCLVYRIPCTCGSCYIGQTKQRLEERLKQHKNDCRTVNFLKTGKTALSSHHFDTGHNFCFDQVSVLHRENNLVKRNLSEMVFIKLNNTINLRSDTQGLNVVYNDILNNQN